MGPVRTRVCTVRSSSGPEEYCAERWGWNSSRARQLIGAAEAAASVTTVTLPPPSNERTARELVRIKDLEERAEVWQQVQQAHGENVTAAKVREAVRLYMAEQEPLPAEALVERVRRALMADDTG